LTAHWIRKDPKDESRGGRAEKIVTAEKGGQKPDVRKDGS